MLTSANTLFCLTTEIREDGILGIFTSWLKRFISYQLSNCLTHSQFWICPQQRWITRGFAERWYGRFPRGRGAQWSGQSGGLTKEQFPSVPCRLATGCWMLDVSCNREPVKWTEKQSSVGKPGEVEHSALPAKVLVTDTGALVEGVAVVVVGYDRHLDEPHP